MGPRRRVRVTLTIIISLSLSPRGRARPPSLTSNNPSGQLQPRKGQTSFRFSVDLNKLRLATSTTSQTVQAFAPVLIHIKPREHYIRKTTSTEQATITMLNKALFNYLAAALLGASSGAQLSVSSSSVVKPGVYAAQTAPSEPRKKRRRITPDAPEVTANDVLANSDVAANVLGALGTDEGGLLLSTPSKATNESAAARDLRALRVAKLAAAMRDGDDWFAGSKFSHAAARAGFERRWNSLPRDLQAEKQLVLAAMESPKRKPGSRARDERWLKYRRRVGERWWNSLPSEVRADKDVVLAAMRAFRYDLDLWWVLNWNLLPAELQAMPDVVEAAIRNGMRPTLEQWKSLPDGVKADKKVVIAAIRSSGAVFESEDWWDSLPARVLRDKDVALAFISRASDRPDPSTRALMIMSAPIDEIQQEIYQRFSKKIDEIQQERNIPEHLEV